MCMSTKTVTQNIHTLANGWHDVELTIDVTKTEAGRYGVTTKVDGEKVHVGWVVLWEGAWRVYISQDNGGRNTQMIEVTNTKANAIDWLTWDFINHNASTRS